MNRKKKTEKIAAEALLIVILTITVLLIVATGCHNNCTHKTHVDNVMDSVEMDCGGEYHGKEGKSEYGEYGSN